MEKHEEAKKSTRSFTSSKLPVLPVYQSKTCGLCGNYDNEPAYEYVTPTNELVSNYSEFVASYGFGGAQCRELVPSVLTPLSKFQVLKGAFAHTWASHSEHYGRSFMSIMGPHDETEEVNEGFLSFLHPGKYFPEYRTTTEYPYATPFTPRYHHEEGHHHVTPYPYATPFTPYYNQGYKHHPYATPFTPRHYGSTRNYYATPFTPRYLESEDELSATPFTPRYHRSTPYPATPFTPRYHHSKQHPYATPFTPRHYRATPFTPRYHRATPFTPKYVESEDDLSATPFTPRYHHSKHHPYATPFTPRYHHEVDPDVTTFTPRRKPYGKLGLSQKLKFEEISESLEELEGHHYATPFTPRHYRATPFTPRYHQAVTFTPKYYDDSEEELRASPFTPRHYRATPFTPRHYRATPFTPKYYHDSEEELRATPFTPRHYRATPFTPRHYRATPFTPRYHQAVTFTPRPYHHESSESSEEIKSAPLLKQIFDKTDEEDNCFHERTIMRDHEGLICFSQVAVPVCKPGCHKGKGSVQLSVPFTCLDRSSPMAKELTKKVRKFGNVGPLPVDVETTPHVEHVRVPEKCVPHK